MDPELRNKLYLQKHKPQIVITGLLVLILPIMVVVSQVTTYYQQQAATPAKALTGNSRPSTSRSAQNLNYELLLKCFDKPNHTNPCTQAEKNTADLNGDGIVNGIDYNLYVRDSVKSGTTK